MMRFDLAEWVSIQVIGAVGLLTGGGILFSGDVLPFFNVPMSTLGMATFGSMLGFAYGTTTSPRSKLYGYGIGGIFIGIWSVVILPQWLGWSWYNPEMMQPALAGVVALLSRFIVPLVIDGLGEIVARVMNKRSTTGGDQ